MNKKLRKIINHYGIEKQLKFFQSEVFELNEQIIKRRNTGILKNAIDGISSAFAQLLNIEQKDYSKERIKEEIADVMVMLKQFQLYYNIPTNEIKEVIKQNIDRQLEIINYEPKHANEEAER